jgi:hypothetical protein
LLTQNYQSIIIIKKQALALDCDPEPKALVGDYHHCIAVLAAASAQDAPSAKSKPREVKVELVAIVSHSSARALWPRNDALFLVALAALQ